jgi:hypothetical protein
MFRSYGQAPVRGRYLASQERAHPRRYAGMGRKMTPAQAAVAWVAIIIVVVMVVSLMHAW